MSTDTGTETREPARNSDTPFRYGAALAEEIERRWQDRWEREGTFQAPNPGEPGSERAKVYLLDMFPYPSGAGLHVGHPLGFIGTDVLGRYLRMTGHNVLHAMGFDAFGLPAEQYAVQTGTHPRTTTEANVARYKAQLRRLGLAHDERRSVATTDVDFYRWTQWIFLQDLRLLLRRAAAPRAADRGTGGRVRGRRPVHPRRAAVGRAVRGRAPRRDRLVPPGLRLGGAGQLVPRPGHRAGERGGHGGRAQRARELPGVPPQPEAVDDADHRVRGPPGRGPGPAGLAGLGQGDAAQLDRPLRGRAGAVRRRRCPNRILSGRHRGLHHPPGHPVRRHLHGAGARAPAGRPDRPRRLAAGHRPALDRRRRRPPPRRSARIAPPRSASPSWTARRTRTRPGSSPAHWPSTRSTGRRSPCSSPTTC